MLNRRSIGVCVLLNIITCGLYGWYWMVAVTNDVNRVTNRQGTSGGMALLLSIITCGIYGIYWAWTIGDALDTSRAQNGVPSGNFPVCLAILNAMGLSIVTMALIQNELNKYSPNY